MGRRGPPPKPTRLKILQGNPGKRRLNQREPNPEMLSELPEPPAHLSLDAQKEWQRAGAVLLHGGILSKADLPAFEVYCALYGRWIGVERQLRGTGLLIRTPNGFPVPNPLLGIASKLIREMRIFMGELGVTPASRSRVTRSESTLREDERAQRTRQYLSVLPGGRSDG